MVKKFSVTHRVAPIHGGTCRSTGCASSPAWTSRTSIHSPCIWWTETEQKNNNYGARLKRFEHIVHFIEILLSCTCNCVTVAFERTWKSKIHNIVISIPKFCNFLETLYAPNDLSFFPSFFLFWANFNKMHRFESLSVSNKYNLCLEKYQSTHWNCSARSLREEGV